MTSRVMRRESGRCLSVVAALLLTVAPVLAQRGAAQRQRFEYHGIRMGDSIADIEELSKGVYCRATLDSLPGVLSCPFNGQTFAGLRFGEPELTLVDRRVARITVYTDADEFTQLVDALTSRWGAPATRSSSTVKNKMGASFQNSTLLWEFADGPMVVERYGASLNLSTVHVVHSKIARVERARTECKRALAVQRDLGGKLPPGCKP